MGPADRPRWALDAGRAGVRMAHATPSTCSFLPPQLLRELAPPAPRGLGPAGGHPRRRRGDPAPSARHAGGRGGRGRGVVHGGPVAGVDGPRRRARHRPARAVVRSAGDPPSGDVAFDEAAEGVEASLALFAEAFGRDSYDGRGGPVSATVHYGQDYVNAFWDGTQLVFGDGDGEVFDRFHGRDRRGRPRVLPRRRAAHRGPGLRGPVRRAQRVRVRRPSPPAWCSAAAARPPPRRTG